MELRLDISGIGGYTSRSQIARVVTEGWVAKEAFCPNCGKNKIKKYPDNKPVTDFICTNCDEDYELKSGQTEFKNRIVDGEYRQMMKKLQGIKIPNLFLLHYNLAGKNILSFSVIPKQFFVPEIIEKRNPLSPTARRAGWTGCNILLNRVPNSGRIFLVQNHELISKQNVISTWQKTLFLREARKAESRGWLVDIMRCIERLGKREFTLNDVYKFEEELKQLHPNNKHVKDKIRQQLQLLRDKRYLNFGERGKYQLN